MTAPGFTNLILNTLTLPKEKTFCLKMKKILAIKNALRYFKPQWHDELAREFYEELKNYGRIYMYRFKPTYDFLQDR